MGVRITFPRPLLVHTRQVLVAGICPAGRGEKVTRFDPAGNRRAIEQQFSNSTIAAVLRRDGRLRAAGIAEGPCSNSSVSRTRSLNDLEELERHMLDRVQGHGERYRSREYGCDR